ncbi:gliding motility lipoprotein GldH [Aggregatimonas sangjinii]|uniref:Gliding motility lipoprotein GldH n=1 Tax=Aggregatimonas sangjinii TaxID=2583587 RepID=A0A5B7SY41_9FLAO|nr:gliding motility lipoprotein GldH [Aggregatimonas sangjinii]QCX01801.1 gliding motility lipoprotein GldH [Aggregatimonas sangjinii]
MRSFFIVLLAFASLVSCDTGLVKSEFKATTNGVWEKDNQIEFTFSELDSLAQYNMFINVRNDDTFPYNNLFLIAELNGPDGSVEKDTLEYQMADPDGTWLGQGYGSLKENKLWYKENIVFPSSGVYTLKVAHAMRKNGKVNGVEQLQGITDVGFEIEQRNK